MLAVHTLKAKYSMCKHVSTKNGSFNLQNAFNNKFLYAPDPAKTVTYMHIFKHTNDASISIMNNCVTKNLPKKAVPSTSYTSKGVLEVTKR